MAMKQQERLNLLEQMIDEAGMDAIISDIQQVAGEKAEHLRSEWQDEGSAKLWEDLAKSLNKAYSMAFKWWY